MKYFGENCFPKAVNTASILACGGVSVLVNILFILLLYKNGGTSEMVSAYFSAQVLLLNTAMVNVGFCEQFLQHYLGQKSDYQQSRFLGTALIATFTVNLIVTGVIYYQMDSIVNLFYGQLAVNQKKVICNFVRTGLVVPLLYPMNSILKGVLNVKRFYHLPLIVNSFIPIAGLFGLYLFSKNQAAGCKLILELQSAGALVSVLVIYIASKKYIKNGSFKSCFDVYSMMRDSLLFRASGSIYTMGLSYIFATILSGLGPLYIAAYGYAEKGANAVYSAITMPLQSIFVPKLIAGFKSGLKLQVKTSIKEYTLTALLSYLPAIMTCIWVIPYVLNNLGRLEGQYGQQEIMLRLFFEISAWKMVIIIIGPYMVLLQIGSKISIILGVNSLVVVIGLLFARYSPTEFKNFTNILFIFLEVISLVVYFKAANKIVAANCK